MMKQKDMKEKFPLSLPLERKRMYSGVKDKVQLAVFEEESVNFYSFVVDETQYYLKFSLDTFGRISGIRWAWSMLERESTILGDIGETRMEHREIVVLLKEFLDEANDPHSVYWNSEEFFLKLLGEICEGKVEKELLDGKYDKMFVISHHRVEAKKGEMFSNEQFDSSKLIASSCYQEFDEGILYPCVLF